jgi:phage shock protein E
MKKFNYIHLFLGFVIVGLGLFIFQATKCHGDECQAKVDNQPIVAFQNENDPKIIKDKLENNEIIVLDVRENDEWASGHISLARHLPLGEINKETTKDLPKDIPIYVYCRSGRRSTEAMAKMNQLGFSNLVNLGGIIDWQKNGGELTR